ncbi:Vesicle membrane receptor protein (v-SNARE) [Pseudogymnoascus australis]
MSSQPYDPYQPSGNAASSAKGAPRAHVDTEQLQQLLERGNGQNVSNEACRRLQPEDVLSSTGCNTVLVGRTVRLPVGSTTIAFHDEIDGATAKMQHNVDKLAQRGENLNALQDKTDNLAISAQGFNSGANRVRRSMWRSNMKWRFIVGGGLLIL